MANWACGRSRMDCSHRRSPRLRRTSDALSVLTLWAASAWKRKGFLPVWSLLTRFLQFRRAASGFIEDYSGNSAPFRPDDFSPCEGLAQGQPLLGSRHSNRSREYHASKACSGFCRNDLGALRRCRAKFWVPKVGSMTAIVGIVSVMLMGIPAMILHECGH